MNFNIHTNVYWRMRRRREKEKINNSLVEMCKGLNSNLFLIETQG